MKEREVYSKQRYEFLVNFSGKYPVYFTFPDIVKLYAPLKESELEHILKGARHRHEAEMVMVYVKGQEYSAWRINPKKIIKRKQEPKQEAGLEVTLILPNGKSIERRIPLSKKHFLDYFESDPERKVYDLRKRQEPE